MKAYEVATLVGVGKLVPNIPKNVPEVLRVVILGILHQIVFFYNNTKGCSKFNPDERVIMEQVCSILQW